MRIILTLLLICISFLSYAESNIETLDVFFKAYPKLANDPDIKQAITLETYALTLKQAVSEKSQPLTRRSIQLIDENGGHFARAGLKNLADECESDGSSVIVKNLSKASCDLLISESKEEKAVEPDKLDIANRDWAIYADTLADVCVFIGRGDEVSAITTLNDLTFTNGRKMATKLDQKAFMYMKGFFSQYKKLDYEHCFKYSAIFVKHTQEQANN